MKGVNRPFCVESDLGTIGSDASLSTSPQNTLVLDGGDELSAKKRRLDCFQV